MKRLETGVVRLEDDWPGIFIRGDNAFGYSIDLKAIERFLSSESNLPISVRMGVSALKSVIKLLDSCNLANHPANIQEVKQTEPKN